MTEAEKLSKRFEKTYRDLKTEIARPIPKSKLVMNSETECELSTERVATVPDAGRSIPLRMAIRFTSRMS